MRRPWPMRKANAIAVSAFLLLVGVLTVAAARHSELASAVAASPAQIARGRLWLLVSSGLLAERPVGASIVSFVLLALLVLIVCGPRTFWWAAVCGHLASTVAIYAVIEVTRLDDPRAFANVFASRDYGVSAISAAWLGALATVGWQIRGRSVSGRCAIALSCAAVGLFAYSARPGLTIIASEHLLAFAFGVAVAARFFDPVNDLERLSAYGTGLARRAASVGRVPQAIRALDPVVLGTVTIAVLVVGGSALPNALADLAETVAPGPLPTPTRCIGAWNHPSGWRPVQIANAPVLVAAGYEQSAPADHESVRVDYCSYVFMPTSRRRFALIGHWRDGRIVSWSSRSMPGDELPTNAVADPNGRLELAHVAAPGRI